ncbi:MAG: tRNA (adenosine(37)-N6)-dimethylallyltransferase MiaA [Clostridiales bacterium]|jgi:tRNA dimethylallyltransferase|nr:tRNA (adenosine(37)-N6)-dimethylallyltransferase MiaA [Clostridiales bacterium]
MHATHKPHIPIIAVVGPTASGKSHLAVELAKWKQTEVVSADSMQIYREMSIGTAKPTPQEQEGVVHHLIDFVDLSQPFSVADYVSLAKKCVQSIYDQGKIPVLVGGTGLYIRSFLENISFSEQDRDEVLRLVLAQKAKEKGIQELVEELKSFDPESAERIDPNNLPRLIRAIEIYRTTGQTMTQQIQQSRQMPSPYQVCMIGLDYADRQVLYDRINRRVDQMLEQGLVEEARRVLAQPNGQTALQAIGYKELQPYFQGEISLEQAAENMKQETRRYAKRQLTWFRREKKIHWIYPDECGGEQVVQQAKEIVIRTFG